MGNFNTKIGIKPRLRRELVLRDKAFSGDIVFSVSPEAVTSSLTDETGTRKVKFKLVNAEGEIHNWFSQTLTGALTLTVNSTSGAATIEDEDLEFENGVAVKEITRDLTTDWEAEDTNVLTLSEQTILGYTIASVASTETVEA